jgi:hypothetical protein
VLVDEVGGWGGDWAMCHALGTMIYVLFVWGWVVQVGKYVAGSYWRKVGFCGVVGVWKRIRTKVSRGSLFL